MFTINTSDKRPIYEQIIDNIKELILKGILRQGEQLPSVRGLATILTVNVNTVMKAYNELEREAVIEIRKGKGAFVKEIPKKVINKQQLVQLRQDLKASCIAMHYMGMSREEIISELSSIYDELIKEESE